MKNLRLEIDRIDKEIVALLQKRMDVAREIGKYKEKANLPIYDPVREAEKLEYLKASLPENKAPYMAEIFAKIMEQCRTFEEDNKAAEVEPFGLLGHRLGHSFSPEIHKTLGGYDFSLIEVEPEDLDSFMTSRAFSGLCVTIPYKRDVMRYCSRISHIAERSNSVNVVVKGPDGRLEGHNTDYYGFTYMVKSHNIQIEGSKCLVLGSGGVSGTVIRALEDMDASEVVTISRRGENNYENLHLHRDADIIVNTTPVGMYPDTGVSPVDLSLFKNCKGVVDLIYNPLKTKLLLDAGELGIPACNGMSMLVAQAAKACELFVGKAISPEEIDSLTRAIELSHCDIFLIGMPGCGKSSIGSSLSETLDLPFVDLDQAFYERFGRSPADVIEEDGESIFRDMETETLKAVIQEDKASSKPRIIACGGGIVERAGNRIAIKENGLVVYIKRSLNDLPFSGRPLSSAEGVDEIYSRRSPLYESWSDVRVTNSGIKQTALAISNILENAEEQ